MAILADKLLAAKRTGNATMDKLSALARISLKRPFGPQNHVAAPHITTAPIIAEDAKAFAERFVFDETIIASTASILKDDESISVAKQHARLPAPVCWFEWSDEGDTLGVLLTEVDREVSFTLFMENQHYGVIPVMTGSLPWPSGEPYRYNILHCKDICGENNEGYAIYISSTLFAFCALLNISGCTHSKRFDWGDKFQRARKRRGKFPLLSFNQVTVALPKVTERKQDVKCDEGHGVRRHRVVGYLRISRHGDPEGHFIWVASHWRGDAALGLVLKQRNVTALDRRHGSQTQEPFHQSIADQSLQTDEVV